MQSRRRSPQADSAGRRHDGLRRGHVPLPGAVLVQRVFDQPIVGLIALAIVITEVSLFIAQLFPRSILPAMIAYITIGAGMATLRRRHRLLRSLVAQ